MSVFDRVSQQIGSKRLSIPAHQAPNHPLQKGKTTYGTWVVTSPSSAANFASTVQFDVREIGILQANYLLVTVSAPTGATNAKFAVAPYMLRRIEYLNNSGAILKTVQSGDENFICHQLLFTDEERAEYNAMVGPYNDSARRIALASAGTQTFFIQLRDPFTQSGSYALLGNEHAFSIRLEFTTLEQVCSYSAQTALASSIVSCQLFTNIIRLPEQKVQEMKMEIQSHGALGHLFTDVVQQTFTIQAGVTSSQFVLSGIQGRVSAICFVVRRADTLYDDNYVVFAPISSYQLTDASATSLLGLTTITHRQNALLINRDLSLSTYLLEGNGLAGDNNANVYFFAFDPSPVDCLKHAVHTNSRRFNGTEVLTINFPGTTANVMQVDVFGFVEGALIQSAGSVVRHLA